MDLIKRKTQILWYLLGFGMLLLMSGCSSGLVDSPGEDDLKVVATTTIVGDVVAQVAGDLVDLQILVPVGTDPHGFDPSPQEVAKVADADVIFATGAGLEEFLDDLIESAGATEKVVHVSEGIDFLLFEGEHDHEHEGEDHDSEGEGHEGADPHTWTDPNNVLIWVHNIKHKLSDIDPDNAEAYVANAEAYEAELEALDAWIVEQVALVPEENRKLVTDHTLFSYFAMAYGFEQIGTLIPGYSTLAEPTARELAAIEDAIRELDVKAIFVGNSVNPALADRVAQDTGVKLIFVYTGSLGESGGDADSYLAYMRYNTSAFVNALK